MCVCSPKTRDTAARTIPPSPSRSEFVPVPGDVTIGIEEYQKGYGTQKYLQTTSTFQTALAREGFPGVIHNGLFNCFASDEMFGVRRRMRCGLGCTGGVPLGELSVMSITTASIEIYEKITFGDVFRVDLGYAKDV